MILAVDVQYKKNTAFVAGVLFSGWQAESPSAEYLSVVHDIQEYEPGNFYKRELPCILKLIEEHTLSPETIVVDGYVHLDGGLKPGLGKRLHDALGNTTDIIGVAKTAFTGIGSEFELCRGKSTKPLYITATSSVKVAKERIKSMHGVYRIPDLLRRTDQVCREAASKSIR